MLIILICASSLLVGVTLHMRTVMMDASETAHDML